MALALLVSSCKTLETEDMFYPENSYAGVEKKAVFTVRLTSADLERTTRPESVFRKKAMEKCFVHTARQVLELQPLLKGSLVAPVAHQDAGFFELKGQINPARATLTDDLVQDFQCSLHIYPYFSQAGEIVALEEQRTMVARGHRVTLTLFEGYPDEMPAYFVIGRKTSPQGVNLISIFGSGRIVQIVGKTSHGEDNLYRNQTLAQGIIMETNHEVAKEDLIFLARMDVRTIETAKETPDISSAPTETEDEIWVRPKVREQETAPSEMK